MIKKIIYIVIAFMILGILIDIFYKYEKNEKEVEIDNLNSIDNEIELSAELVSDDCLNEWEDYAITVQNEIEETSSIISTDNKEYIIIAEDNVIKVYYINENNEKVLYKVTDISLEYLPEEDREELESGINVRGIEELNNQLEDYE